MKKIIVLTLALLTSSMVSAQEFSLEQNTCHSIRVVHPFEGYDHYAILLIEKEQLSAIWSKVERVKLQTATHQIDDLSKGTYRATLITPDGERQVSNSVLIDCDNPNDTLLAPFEVYISPNPAASQLQVRIPTAEDMLYSYYLISSQGLILSQGEISSPVQTIEIDQLRSGMYFLKVVSPNHSTNIKKLIIQ